VITDQTITEYSTLFRGRGDVYGSDEGGCVKAPLNRERFISHLTGVEPIGVYPIVPIGTIPSVVWGCSDFDLGMAESLDSAIKLHDSLLAAGVTSWIERSRSKGFHVWVFAEQPVPAQDMRNMLLAAHQVANLPAKEVNPKQVELKTNQYGNYVRLPYPYAENLSTTHQRVVRIGDYTNAMPLAEFTSSAMKSRATATTIKHLAEFYKPPTPKLAPVSIEYDATLDEAMQVLSPLGKVIWRDGPLPTKDRSSTLAKLGYECAKTGLNPSQTKIILKTADKRWGKYHLRPNGESEIDKLVIRVHS